MGRFQDLLCNFAYLQPADADVSGEVAPEMKSAVFRKAFSSQFLPACCHRRRSFDLILLYKCYRVPDEVKSVPSVSHLKIRSPSRGSDALFPLQENKMASPTSSRVIIIGAGWTGLAAAKTYLQLFPSVTLTIIDADTTVGGVWSASRIYPGLIADSCAAIFDYSDFPIDEVLGIDKWADLPAEQVHKYLEAYVDRFGLRRRLRLGTRVIGVEKFEESEGKGVWAVEVEDIVAGNEGPETREVLRCDKLIVATGTSSTPSFPRGINWKPFDGRVMHSKEVGTNHQLLTADSIKRVTVVGGNKSAVDVVNLCVLGGKEVDWVIRKEGYGPGVLFEARTHGIHAGAIKAIRASAIPSPNILATSGFWCRFFHSGKSWLGNLALKFLLSKLDESAMSMYSRNKNTMKIAPDVKQ